MPFRMLAVGYKDTLLSFISAAESVSARTNLPRELLSCSSIHTMTPVVHIIDPDADTVITLRNASTRFAIWRYDIVEVDRTTREGSFESSNTRKETEMEEGHQVQAGAVHLQPESDSASIAALLQDLHLRIRAMKSDVISVPEEAYEDEIHYHVSSRHLMLASPIFKRALDKDGFEESVRNEKDGLFHIDASDWDAEAFLIVMRIIHGRNRQVPKEIALEMLAEIAVLEDYYLFGESLEVFKDLWLQKIKEIDVPNTYCRDLVLWIWVTWVFDVEEHFKKATMLAMTHSTCDIPTFGLPIPTKVIGMPSVLLALRCLTYTR
jgi:hypothetical protein